MSHKRVGSASWRIVTWCSMAYDGTALVQSMRYCLNLCTAGRQHACCYHTHTLFAWVSSRLCHWSLLWSVNKEHRMRHVSWKKWWNSPEWSNFLLVNRPSWDWFAARRPYVVWFIDCNGKEWLDLSRQNTRFSLHVELPVGQYAAHAAQHGHNINIIVTPTWQSLLVYFNIHNLPATLIYRTMEQIRTALWVTSLDISIVYLWCLIGLHKTHRLRLHQHLCCKSMVRKQGSTRITGNGQEAILAHLPWCLARQEVIFAWCLSHSFKLTWPGTS